MPTRRIQTPKQDIAMIDRRGLLGSAASAAVLMCVQPAFAARRWPTAPRHPKRPVSVARFGPPRVDDYAWMRPDDWQAVLRNPASLDPPIMAAVKVESDYAQAMLGTAKPLQAGLAKRAAELSADDDPIEIEDNGFVYFQRIPKGSDYEVYFRRDNGSGREESLLDLNDEAKGKKFYALHSGGTRRSNDGKLFGWSVDETGSGIFAIKVREISTGRMIVDDLKGAHGSFALAPRGDHLYWVGRNDQGNSNSVWRRDFLTGRDVLIFSEPDPAFFISVRASASGEIVFIDLLNGEVTETRMIPAADPTAAPVVIEPRKLGHSYFVDHWNGRLIIRTDAEGAEDFKLVTAPVETPRRANWHELVPHRKGRFIANVHPFRNALVREEWRDARPRLVVMAKDGSERDVGFEDAAYALTVPEGQGWDAQSLAFSYQSPVAQPRFYKVALDTGVARPARQSKAVAAFNPARYRVERIEAVASDGERIPITILTSASAKRDGSRPLLLYGYGSYGATVPDDFSPAAIALVERGFSYAIAHVRGGAERGTYWWRSVLARGKKTTFTDFITCAEHLIAKGYTGKQRIVAHGYSAGGLLMGAIYTMRPDLWAGVIAQVPFVDVLNTIEAFESHPLGTTSFPFWGDPRIPEDHAYMASYSPYDNLKPASYPALLATGSVADERVAFWEPLKFAVKARQMTQSSAPILAKISTVGGHMGKSGSSAERDQLAEFHAFAIWAAEKKWDTN
jgi:oligopeptidase B